MSLTYIPLQTRHVRSLSATTYNAYEYQKPVSDAVR